MTYPIEESAEYDQKFICPRDNSKLRAYDRDEYSNVKLMCSECGYTYFIDY